MRSNPAEYELVAPGKLPDVISLLAQQPGEWTPIAGGTDLMVLYAAGKLAARKLVSLWNLTELKRIEVSEGEISIGAGCTYSDLREHPVVEQEFPLLAAAARWTGGIANQNRGTLGGNIVNASPAADSLPALLVYEAELILVSIRGERRVKYLNFHTGYKKTLLAADELIRAVCLPRQFAEYIFYSRKVGARNAQAISKTCIAALGRVRGGLIEDVRIAAGSVAPVPIRLTKTEQLVTGKPIDDVLLNGFLNEVRETVQSEIQPIDDIRSIAAYRLAVLGNLVVEFLQRLRVNESNVISTLMRWNQLTAEAAANEMMSCCGSSKWAQQLSARRPFSDESQFLAASDKIWDQMETSDVLEAFSKHPRIGEKKAPSAASSQSAAWSKQEQSRAASAGDAIQASLAEANREYEQKFGRVFIICATGKSADEILAMLRQRLQNDDASELRVAAEEQRKITNLRLKKWLEPKMA